MDRGAWWAKVYGIAKSRTQLSNFHMPLYQAIGLMVLASFWLKNKRHSEDFFSYSSKKQVLQSHLLPSSFIWGFPCGSAGKASACNMGDLGSIPGSG